MRAYMYLNLLLVFFSFNCTSKAQQPEFIWGRQFGSDKEEVGTSVATDRQGNVFLVGTTTSSLFGNNMGERDGYIIKFDTLGNILWNKQFGSKEDDCIRGVAVDNSGNSYLMGYTNEISSDKKNVKQDIFLYKFDVNGNQIFEKQFKTDSLGNGYQCKILVDDVNNIIISGDTKGNFGGKNAGKSDCFFMKLDSSGSVLFIKQFGTDEDDFSCGLTTDKYLNIYICGRTKGKLDENKVGDFDAFIAKYSKNGELLWMKQYGIKEFNMGAAAIVIDNECQIYVAGGTNGNFAGLNQGKGDCILMKLDSIGGQILWKKQFGTNFWDEVWGIGLIKGNPSKIAISGCLAEGSGSTRSYCSIYNSDGNLIWNLTLAAQGKTGGTNGRYLTVYDNKYIYFTGATNGNMFQENKGQSDAYLIKLGLTNK